MPVGILFNEEMEGLVGRLELLLRSLLPAADQPRNLFGRKQPQPVQEIGDRVCVRPEFAFGRRLCRLVDFGFLVVLDYLGFAFDRGQFVLNSDLLDGIRPRQEQSLVFRLLQIFFEDDCRDGIQSCVAYLRADAGPVRDCLHVLGVLGGDGQPGADLLARHLDVTAHLLIALRQLADGLARGLPIGLGGGSPGVGDRLGIVGAHLLEAVEDFEHLLGIWAVEPDVVVGQVVCRLTLEIGVHVLRFGKGLGVLAVVFGFRRALDIRILIEPFAGVVSGTSVASPEHEVLRCSPAEPWGPRLVRRRSSSSVRVDESSHTCPSVVRLNLELRLGLVEEAVGSIRFDDDIVLDAGRRQGVTESLDHGYRDVLVRTTEDAQDRAAELVDHVGWGRRAVAERSAGKTVEADDAGEPEPKSGREKGIAPAHAEAGHKYRGRLGGCSATGPTGGVVVQVSGGRDDVRPEPDPGRLCDVGVMVEGVVAIGRSGGAPEVVHGERFDAGFGKPDGQFFVVVVQAAGVRKDQDRPARRRIWYGVERFEAVAVRRRKDQRRPLDGGACGGRNRGPAVKIEAHVEAPGKCMEPIVPAGRSGDIAH